MVFQILAVIGDVEDALYAHANPQFGLQTASFRRVAVWSSPSVTAIIIGGTKGYVVTVSPIRRLKAVGMLSRYKIYRGSRPDDDPLPEGIRQDTRKHTQHCLRPPADAVCRYLASPSAHAWRIFEENYLSALERRFNHDPTEFNVLAALAEHVNVFLGCSCPTNTNPDPRCCHTVAALRFMKGRFPVLWVGGLPPD